MVLSPPFLGAPPRAGVFVIVEGLPTVSRSLVVCVKMVPEIRCLVLVRLDVSVDVERVLALLHLLQQLVQVGRLWKQTDRRKIYLLLRERSSSHPVVWTNSTRKAVFSL